ncbi:hypothetical protein BD626DRAFT_27084 [Schizophyllum amplum]|uniref:Uncharacterized protein n=1 Tax=Schizophyllum amplum TaxID=97359 RepID=A0A550CZU8_9AGAR|nr:hypothetical protein BD626DRAFT_27084 [Auriculariopsis ampla]
MSLSQATMSSNGMDSWRETPSPTPSPVRSLRERVYQWLPDDHPSQKVMLHLETYGAQEMAHLLPSSVLDGPSPNINHITTADADAATPTTGDDEDDVEGLRSSMIWLSLKRRISWHVRHPPSLRLGSRSAWLTWRFRGCPSSSSSSNKRLWPASSTMISLRRRTTL